jgi:DNA-binding transcriptional MocR family regulator
MTEPYSPPELAGILGRWSAGRGPIYVLLAARLRDLIVDEVLRPGTRLPPERALARTLAVGRNTVVAAYDVLRSEGRIERRRGSGTTVAGSAEPTAEPAAWSTSSAMFLHLFEPTDGVIALSCAAPERPPPEVSTAMVEAADRLTTGDHGIGYHPAGLPELREAIAERFRQRGLPTDADQLLVTNGGQQAISLLAEDLLAPGDRVVVEAPTYSGALEAFRATGAILQPAPVGLAGLRRLLTETRPRAVYAIPTHHNPTGTTMSDARRAEVARLADGRGVILIEDEVLADLCLTTASAPRPLAAWSPSVVTVGSLSKSVWGGIRVGWLRGPRQLVTRLARRRAVHDLGGSVLAQLIAAALLPDLDALLARSASERRRRHAALHDGLRQALPSWRFTPAGGGQTLWVELPAGDGVSFAQTALRHGVSVLPGDGLDITTAGSRHVRLHFVQPADLLHDVVRRLAEAWHDYRPPATPGRFPPPLAV